MLRIEAGIEQRFPQVFSGSKALFTKPLLRQLARFNRFDFIERLAAQHAHLQGHAFVEAILRQLDCRYLIDDVERECIPETGRCLIVANHPLGGLDALALLKCVCDVRRDVMIVANDVLEQIEGIRSLLLPVRIIGGKPTAASLEAVQQALDQDKAVIVFPAGEVSRLGWRGIRDGRWRHGFLAWAEQRKAPIVVAHLQARNSAIFYGFSALYRPLGAALLAREATSGRSRRIPIRLQAIGLHTATTSTGRLQLASRIRDAVYAAARSTNLFQPDAAPLAHACKLRDLLKDIESMQCIGETSDGKLILCGQPGSDSALMHEIARLRELTFRSVGEGSGKRLDRDRFDAHYQHLVVWDNARLELAGAYRIADCREVLSRHGMAGLYCASLFRFTPELAAQLDGAMELGRSFVQPKYWGSRSLDYLWTGIGAWLRTRPHIRQLFGPVSISAALPLPAREWLVAYYSRFFGDNNALARANHPFRYERVAPDFGTLDADASLAVLRNNLAALGARIPTLYKQYTELCEPGGARFIAFGVDPEFSNSIDGLIWVDINRVTPRKRQRYLESPPPKTTSILTPATETTP
ncbi:MAG: GNAT family N-acyltransferase [Pseudomonadota bacterium]|nr:GNAT family N-acyltransferase [Pseudomonadota bacterium]